MEWNMSSEIKKQMKYEGRLFEEGDKREFDPDAEVGTGNARKKEKKEGNL